MFEKYFIGSGHVPDSTGAHVSVHPAKANSPQRELARDAFTTSREAHLCNSKGKPCRFKTPPDAHHTKADSWQVSSKRQSKHCCHRMSGQNKTFNATNTDGPAILRWNIVLELLILVVGGAAHVFYRHAPYPGQKWRLHFVLATHECLNTVGGACRSRHLVPHRDETDNFHTSDAHATGILRAVWW